MKLPHRDKILFGFLIILLIIVTILSAIGIVLNL